MELRMQKKALLAEFQLPEIAEFTGNERFWYTGTIPAGGLSVAENEC
jgi:hypothetical protein